MYMKVGYGILSFEKQLSILNYSYRAFEDLWRWLVKIERERRYQVFGSSSELQEWEADNFLFDKVVESAFKCAHVDPTWRESSKLLPNPISPKGERTQGSEKKSYQKMRWISLMVVDLRPGARCSELRTYSEDAVTTGLLRKWVSTSALYSAVNNNEISPSITSKFVRLSHTFFQKLTAVPWEPSQFFPSTVSAMTNSNTV